MGKGIVLGVSQGPIPKWHSSSALQFWGFSSTYDYTLRRITTNLGVVTHMGRGCLKRSATPLYLHKWVARFVSLSFSTILIDGITLVQDLRM